MNKSIASMAGIDPRVGIFALSVIGVVTLVGMTLGYDVELNAFGGSIRITKSQREGLVRR